MAAHLFQTMMDNYDLSDLISQTIILVLLLLLTTRFKIRIRFRRPAFY